MEGEIYLTGEDAKKVDRRLQVLMAEEIESRDDIHIVEGIRLCPGNTIETVYTKTFGYELIRTVVEAVLGKGR